MMRCIVKHNPTIYGIPSLLGYGRTRTHARWLRNMAARVEDCLSVSGPRPTCPPSTVASEESACSVDDALIAKRLCTLADILAMPF